MIQFPNVCGHIFRYRAFDENLTQEVPLKASNNRLSILFSASRSIQRIHTSRWSRRGSYCLTRIYFRITWLSLSDIALWVSSHWRNGLRILVTIGRLGTSEIKPSPQKSQIGSLKQTSLWTLKLSNLVGITIRILKW